MKTLGMISLALVLVACTTAVPVKKPHGLTGGVKEPTYDVVNCWVQPPHDELWYPCPNRFDAEGYSYGHGH